MGFYVKPNTDCAKFNRPDVIFMFHLMLFLRDSEEQVKISALSQIVSPPELKRAMLPELQQLLT